MRKQLPKIILYVAVLLLVFAAYQPVMRLDDNYVVPENGVADPSGLDLSRRRARIYAQNWEYYPGHLYTPDDFAQGKTVSPTYENNADPAEYGTYRVTVLLPAGITYGMTGRSFLFSQRVYIDGRLVDEVGSPGESREATVPRTKTYAYYFTPESETTEIIFQVANFHQPDGGGSFSFSLGQAPIVERYRMQRIAGTMVVAGCLLTIFLFFLGLFIFFARRRYFLYFACAGLMIALRAMLVGDKPIMEFFPGLDWHLAIRAEYIDLILIVVFFLLYISSLYPGMLHRAVTGTVLGASALYGLVVLLADPLFYSGFVSWYAVLWAAAGLWILYKLIRRLRRGGLQEWLIFIGFVVFLVAAVNDQIQHSLPVYMTWYDATLMGMVVFLFMNMTALTLGFSETETELSEARAQERTLRENNQMLDRLGKMKTQFMANMSHEMKTPLTVMSANAQLSKALVKTGADEQEIVQSLDVVSAEAERLARMVSEVLDLSSMRENQSEMEPLDMALLLSKTAEAYRALLEKRGNRLALSLPDSLPPVQGNADMLVQVVVNLLANAGAHTEGGKITLAAAAADGAVTVDVTDDGAGIPAELLPHVFERYRKDGGGGTGLGLPLCKTIIERHGGTITADSAPGAGTRIRFTLPVGSGELRRESGE